MKILDIMPERLQQQYIPVKNRQLPIVSQDNTIGLMPYDYYVSVLCTFKNEALNIKNWVDHYLWMGVDHLYLIDNGSDDNCQDILLPYVQKGLATVFYKPEKYKQQENYREIYRKYIRHKSKWVIIADSDEFWYVKDSTIRDTLPLYEKYNVIMSQWRNFGTDGHIQHPPDIRTAIVHRQKRLECTKCIFKSKNVEPEQVNIHAIDGKIEHIFKNSNIFCLNHYPIQSKEYFETVKMIRRSAASITKINRHNMTYFNTYNSNTDILDTTLKEMVEKAQQTISIL